MVAMASSERTLPNSEEALARMRKAFLASGKYDPTSATFVGSYVAPTGALLDPS